MDNYTRVQCVTNGASPKVFPYAVEQNKTVKATDIVIILFLARIDVSPTIPLNLIHVSTRGTLLD